MQDPSHLLSRAVDLHHKGNLSAAEGLYLQVLEAESGHFDALQMLGMLRYQQGRMTEALSLIGAALAVRPDFPPVLLNYAVVLDGLQRREEALVIYDRVLALKPDYAEAWFNRGIALRQLKRGVDAVASFDKMLAIVPGDADALGERGIALRDLKRPQEALTSFDRALVANPGNAEIFNNRGNALRDLDRMEEALASYDQALAIRPSHVEALKNRGSVLRSLNRPADALASFDRALAIRPNDPGALNNRGNALQDLHRHEEALASFEKALALKPDDGYALNNRGNALTSLKRYTQSLASFDAALKLKPNDAEALNGRAIPLRELQRSAEALASYEKALQVDPDHPYAFSGLADTALAVCDWARTEALAPELRNHIAHGRSIIAPFTALAYGVDPAAQLQCAENYIAHRLPASTRPLWSGEVWRQDKLRIAYLSPDFRRHAVAFLMAELLERHDHDRFEIVGISFGPDDRSEIRTRLVRAFDQFRDVRSQGSHDVAKVMNDLHVHIAVDLNGHAGGIGLGILAHRPAPIQASYLGYASTTGAGFIDYVIADRIALPFDQQPFYKEKIVHLPDCFLPTDTKKPASPSPPARRELGLPDGAFVFCAFNNSYKITPVVFDVWMRLLKGVRGSVLWLSVDENEAVANLRREATARGVDPARLIFAPKIASVEDHLARYRAADLFLDTLPYNAHATASDALWEGLPVLTCKGASFAGRVAASLLSAAGLPELATADLGEYEALALRLATDASLLGTFRRRLERGRPECRLFDMARLCRHLESAYATMWESHQLGEAPRSFSVHAQTAASALAR
jgi:predicted O-linked N-acetylglucosamine transferase (SPINDLY family)